MSFDTKCYDLAVAFLPVDANYTQCDELAQIIQDAIEDYLEGHTSDKAVTNG